MEFCEKCNSLMKITPDGLVCPKCGFSKLNDMDIISISRPDEAEPEPIYSGGKKEDSLKVQRTCPKCGHPEAYQTITVSIGEHAGVKNDRSIRRYKCTKCFHVWIEY
ncbi:hypothetical protein GF326_05045 [Candidatus Bathyarchaeota archaeon]|nr:hypothetical protein [Candidatus Bathyarchaeota archaeon]